MGKRNKWKVTVHLAYENEQPQYFTMQTNKKPSRERIDSFANVLEIYSLSLPKTVTVKLFDQQGNVCKMPEAKNEKSYSW